MIVAARARNSQSQEALGERVDLVVAFIGAGFDEHHIVASEPGADAEESQRGQQLGPVRGGHQVGGDLGADEPIVRHVFIEGLDHPVAIAPGVGITIAGRAVAEEHRAPIRHAGAVGVASDIQPVPRPALAIVWRSEQLVDQLRISFGRVVGEESVDLLGRRRQPDQVIGGTPDQCPFVGRASGFQTLLLDLGEDETIDWGLRPSRVLDCRGGWFPDRLERPEIALLRP